MNTKCFLVILTFIHKKCHHRLTKKVMYVHPKQSRKSEKIIYVKSGMQRNNLSPKKQILFNIFIIIIMSTEDFHFS